MLKKGAQVLLLANLNPQGESPPPSSSPLRESISTDTQHLQLASSTVPAESLSIGWRPAKSRRTSRPIPSPTCETLVPLGQEAADLLWRRRKVEGAAATVARNGGSRRRPIGRTSSATTSCPWSSLPSESLVSRPAALLSRLVNDTPLRSHRRAAHLGHRYRPRQLGGPHSTSSCARVVSRAALLSLVSSADPLISPPQGFDHVSKRGVLSARRSSALTLACSFAATSRRASP